MANDIERIAKRLDAKLIGHLPDIGGGAFGAARHAQFEAAEMAARLDGIRLPPRQRRVAG